MAFITAVAVSALNPSSLIREFPPPATLRAFDAVSIGQNTPGREAFDVTSVKPNRSGGTRISVSSEGNRFAAINVPPMLLVRLAFGVPEYRIVDIPDWARTDRFDVVGTTAALLNRARQNALLQALLRDRFMLVAHQETRELPIYILVRARPDGAVNTQLKASRTDCAALLAAVRTGVPLPPSNRILCGVQGRPEGVSIGGMTISEVAAEVLSPEAGRLVVDRTGLEGPFDFDLDFARTSAPACAAGTTWLALGATARSGRRHRDRQDPSPLARLTDHGIRGIR
jgi:uncharacterized protein (TIGR03435 family)